MGKKKKELSLSDKLIRTNDFDELNEIVEMFNLDLQKKNLIRGVKLSEVQDKVVDQLSMRLTERADNFSNEDLIKYLKTIQETLNKTTVTTDDIKAPTIQINQQVNVDNVNNFNAESRKRILSAVNSIMNGDTEELKILQGNIIQGDDEEDE